MGSLQCPDTVGWVTGRTSGPFINLCLLSSKGSFPELVEEEKLAGKQVTGVHLAGKWLAAWHNGSVVGYEVNLH